jgi:DNA helicase HerA-like ATPase
MAVNPTLLGTVQDVSGATVSVVLDPQTLSGLVFIEGHGYRIGQVGSFVRIPMGFVDLFGIVSQVGAGAIPSPLAERGITDYRWMTVELVGEGERGKEFKRGISQYPTVGDQVHLLTEVDLSRIYGRAEAGHIIRIGHLASAESIPALVDLNALVTRHSAVIGTTGSGKSTTVASLLLALSDPERYPSSRVLVFDMHGEYAAALGDRAVVFRVNANESQQQRPLFVPYWALTFDELLAVSFGTVDDASRGSILEKVFDLKLKAINNTPRRGVTSDTLTVDTPVPFSIHALWFDFHRAMHATHTVAGGQSEQTEALVLDQQGTPVQIGDAIKVIPPKYMPHSQTAPRVYLSQSALNFRRPLDRLASRLRDPRFDFLFRPGKWLPDLAGTPNKDLDSQLTDWIGGDKPITILDLSGVPVSVVSDLAGAMLRIVYDALFWSRNLVDGARKRPLLVVLEEAHAYVGKDLPGGAGQAIRRIVKEGRKYGIGAMIISQRPSELDSTVLSQCGTLFALRLSNATDRGQVTGTVTDNLEGLMAMLPVLRTGEAIIVGEAVHLPVRTLLDPPPMNQRPDSSDPLVHDVSGQAGWNKEKQAGDYEAVLEVWRKQDPAPPPKLAEASG